MNWKRLQITEQRGATRNGWKGASAHSVCVIYAASCDNSERQAKVQPRTPWERKWWQASSKERKNDLKRNERTRQFFYFNQSKNETMQKPPRWRWHTRRAWAVQGFEVLFPARP